MSKIRECKGLGVYRVSRCVLLLYVATYVVVSVVHEPWFDESQSWQIARCASITDILFVIPHYEGHPPLWHLILVPLAKSGIPFEIGIKTVGFVLATASAYLVIFRSPFPTIVRLLLPFNYFLFYQYGTIVRPYSLMYLLLLLLAITFDKKDEHPYWFVGILITMCFAHAYGLLVSAGFAVAFCIDMVSEKGVNRFLKEVLTDKRTRSLMLLLIAALGIVFLIRPNSDTYNDAFSPTVSLWKRLVFCVFGLLAECLVTCNSGLTSDRAMIQLNDVPFISLLSACIVGTIILLLVILFSSKKSLKYFTLPYLLFATFGGAVYLSTHHFGVGLLVLIFWLWITCNDENKLEGYRFLECQICMSKKDKRIVAVCGKLFCAACLAVPVYWAALSCFLDYQKPYSPARDFSVYIEKHGLKDALIFNSWQSGSIEGANPVTDLNTTMVGDVSTLLAYFDTNIIDNVEKGYLEYRIPSREENASNLKEWRALGVPELLIGKVDLEGIFGDEVSLEEYSLVYVLRSDHIWKGRENLELVPVYLRTDCLDRYQAETPELTATESILLTGSFQIPKEDLENLKAGKLTADELVDRLKL